MGSTAKFTQAKMYIFANKKYIVLKLQAEHTDHHPTLGFVFEEANLKCNGKEGVKNLMMCSLSSFFFLRP